MPCSQIESVKMIMLQVASNHFSISRMPIFAPHIFLFPIKQSWRGNNDHYPWPFDHFSVDLRNIIQKHQRSWLKLPLIFPMHCIKNSFIQSPVSSWDQKWPGQSIENPESGDMVLTVFSVFWLQITKQRTTERISDV